jgi:tetratricopeptide (TPR) repeat protein
VIAVLALLLSSPPAHASPRALAQCLNEVDVACAERVISGVDLERERNPEVLYLAARARFFGGRFDDAATLIDRAVALGYEDRWDERALFSRTRDVGRDFVEARRGERYVVRYRPGLDRVLVEEALDTLELAEKHLAPLLGGAPPGPITAELYATGRGFTAASSLSEKDVKTTGVVALSKWSRLLVTSPRALGRGYPWRDTLAHEYIHQVVSHHTGEQAPVWLQEGVAKYLDNRWRDGKDRFRLDPRSETLVAAALAKGELVPFEMMHPSLAKLPSADLAALAYAQLASLLHFVFTRAGEQVLPGVFAQIKRGVDPRQALSEAAGFKSFEQLEGAWRDWVRRQGLRDLEVQDLPTNLDAGGDVMGTDPVMAARNDLAKFVRLGELLLERGHAEAALIELAKADGEEGAKSPLLQTRIAEAHLARGELTTARTVLARALELYPDFGLAWKALARVEKKAGRPLQARDALARALELDPFDLELHDEIAPMYEKAGDSKRASRHREQAAILRAGG